MANLRKGVAVPAALENAIQAIAEVASYLDSHVTKGRTTSDMQRTSKTAVDQLAKTMAALRKAHTKYGSDD